MNRVGYVVVGFAVFALSGCHPFRNMRAGCHLPQEYQHVQERAPLRIPAGLATPNLQGALVIPQVENTAPPRTRNESCLEEPPKYRAAPPSKPLPAS